MPEQTAIDLPPIPPPARHRRPPMVGRTVAGVMALLLLGVGGLLLGLMYGGWRDATAVSVPQVPASPAGTPDVAPSGTSVAPVAGPRLPPTPHAALSTIGTPVVATAAAAPLEPRPAAAPTGKRRKHHHGRRALPVAEGLGQ